MKKQKLNIHGIYTEYYINHNLKFKSILHGHKIIHNTRSYYMHDVLYGFSYNPMSYLNLSL